MVACNLHGTQRVYRFMKKTLALLVLLVGCGRADTPSLFYGSCVAQIVGVRWMGPCLLVDQSGTPGFNNLWHIILRPVGGFVPPFAEVPRSADLVRGSQNPDGSFTDGGTLVGVVTITPYDPAIKLAATGTGFEVRPQYMTVHVTPWYVDVTFDEPVGGFLSPTWTADLADSFKRLSHAK